MLSNTFGTVLVFTSISHLIMNLTYFVVNLLKLSSYITGCRSWMLKNCKEYTIWYDGCFWVCCCYLALIGFATEDAISRRFAVPNLLTIMKFFSLFISLQTVMGNIFARRKRRETEIIAARIFANFCSTSKPILIIVPIIMVLLIYNVIGTTELRLPMLCYFTTVVTELDIGLISLAIAESFSQIGAAVAIVSPSSAKSDLPAVISAHRNLAKFVTELGRCYMHDYFLISVTCLVRCMYLIIDVIQDVNNAKNPGSAKLNFLTSLVFATTTSGRFLLTCYAGSRLTAKSKDALESLLNFHFQHYWFLDKESDAKIVTFAEQLHTQQVCLSVYKMFNLGLGTFATFLETTVSYVIVVVNTVASANSGKKTT